ncbi:MAG TPA: SUMF1/EgtB/PvdO family nonheme iron enzyme [Kofleriaceae bacterium]|nr:SUMF1/EgtB/PvdO family nonheme iron enzyme [Kofleriaceae bacterium]
MGRTPGATALLLTTFAVGTSFAGDHPGRVVRVEAPKRIEVFVPAGRFLMGVDPDTASAAAAQCDLVYSPMMTGYTSGNPPVRVNFCEDYSDMLAAMQPREVHLDAFAIDRLEVTVADYRRCIAAGACKLDPLVAGDERYIRDEWPMVNATWDEAQDYCRWRKARLPTEAEWERAARGTDPLATWPWGELEQPRDFNHGQPRAYAMRQIERQPSTTPLAFFGDPDDSDGAALLAPPGSYVWGESPTGTRDQAGNVAEWTADTWQHDDRIKGYTGLRSGNPVRDGSPHEPRVVRGGSWRQPVFVAKSNLRDPFNALYEPTRRFSHVGFRCARSVR